MRLTLAALAISLFAFATYAEEKPSTPPAYKPTEKQTPTVPEVVSPESSMRVTPGSGGKSKSSLVTEAPLSNDFFMGQADAPITMIEYASMSCPHCAHFANNVLPELEKKYIATGKIKYVLRQLPGNEPALKAAMLLHCVGDQNREKYFVFAKVLFDAQNKWAFDGNFMSGLETIAMVGGLTKDQFNNCVNSTDRQMEVLKVKKAASEELHIPHTPYIFIAGEVYEGDRSVADVSKFIDAKLEKIGRK